jgi:hypothetical protein
VRTIFSIFAVFGFMASLSAHLATFFDINVMAYFPGVWLLHVGIFIGVIPLINKDLWRKVFLPCPPWARYSIIAFAAYALINFLIFLALSKGGSADIRNGVYVLHNHGNVIKELTEQEYQRQQAYSLRGFSGHWMIFYLLPALHSWYRED